MTSRMDAQMTSQGIIMKKTKDVFAKLEIIADHDFAQSAKEGAVPRIFRMQLRVCSNILT